VRTFFRSAWIAAIGAFALGLESVPAQTLPTLSVPATLQCTEGGTVALPVTRSGSKATTASFRYTTVNGTAIAGQDFAGMSGQQSVRKNSYTYTFSIRCQPDNQTFTGNKAFKFTITAVSGATIARATTDLTILENDAAPPPPPPTDPVPPPPTSGTIAVGSFVQMTADCVSQYPYTAKPDAAGVWRAAFRTAPAGAIYRAITPSLPPRYPEAPLEWAVDMDGTFDGEGVWASFPATCMKAVAAPQ